MPEPTYTYDLSSANATVKARSRVRKHIPDREAPWSFNDVEIDDSLEENNGNTKLAAADLLESKATDEAFVQKVQETLGEKTDGAKTGDFVIKRAQMLRDQVKAAATAAKPAAYDYSIAPYRDIDEE
jgi:hypothetical protein